MGFWTDRLNEFHWGHWCLSKIQFAVFGGTILLKLFDAVLWLYFVFPVVVVGVTWILGWLFERFGVRRRFMINNWRGVDFANTDATIKKP